MATEPERIILTYDDYAQLPDDRYRYELHEGELEMTPAPGTLHQRTVLKLATWLVRHVQEYHLGEVLIAPCDVLLSEITVVQPDLLFVSRERLAIVEPRYVRGTPDLVIEVIFPSTAQTDRHAKRQLYARYGVPHYWIFDPEQREAVGLVLRGGTYQQVARACDGEFFTAAPFPDLVIPLMEIWG